MELGFWGDHSRVLSLPHNYRVCHINMTVIGAVNLDCLVKVESARFFYCKGTTFLFGYSVLWK